MTQKSSFVGDRWLSRIDPLPAQSETLMLPVGGEASIAITPGAGTVTVEYSCSAPSDIAAGQGLFVLALGLGTAGVVSSPEINTIPSTITAVRVTATQAGARVEVAQ